MLRFVQQILATVPFMFAWSQTFEGPFWNISIYEPTRRIESLFDYCLLLQAQALAAHCAQRGNTSLQISKILLCLARFQICCLLIQMDIKIVSSVPEYCTMLCRKAHRFYHDLARVDPAPRIGTRERESRALSFPGLWVGPWTIKSSSEHQKLQL